MEAKFNWLNKGNVTMGSNVVPLQPLVIRD